MRDIYDPSKPARRVRLISKQDRSSTGASIITLWSLYHFISCYTITMALLFLGIEPSMAFTIVLFLGVAYEYKDFNLYYIKREVTNSTLDNSLGDIIFNTLGSLYAIYIGYTEERLFLAILLSIWFNILFTFNPNWD
jgi:hypothetical protein